MLEILVKSTLDGSEEPCLLHMPETVEDAPLLVGLHTWSHDRFNQVDNMLPLARERNWALLLPEFRGGNLPTNPRGRQACASEVARQDIVDAIDVVLERYPGKVDSATILLLGGSGGGHMALMMAAYRPLLWHTVSAWCPITDLALWHAQREARRPQIEACCGDTPSEVPREYAARSPMSYLSELARATLFIHHGRWDGVDGPVPYGHSLNLYNALVRQAPDAEAFLDIFDGGHELRYEQAFALFDTRLAAGCETVALTG